MTEDEWKAVRAAFGITTLQWVTDDPPIIRFKWLFGNEQTPTGNARGDGPVNGGGESLLPPGGDGNPD